MNVDKLNVSQIWSVKSFIKVECNNYEYLKERKFLFWVTQKEGYYRGWISDRKYCTKEEIEAGGKLFCKDKTVFYKPHIEIRMSNQTIHNKFFDTEKELNDFMESDQMKSVVWINKDK